MWGMGGGVVVSAGHEYVGGMRGIGGLCEMCMCLARTV